MSHILIVDDEPQIRNILRVMLEQEGYSVDEAEEGEMALKMHEENPCDLMILDIVMPGMEGLETLMRFRKNYPDVKVIMMSGGGKSLTMSFLPAANKLGAVKTFQKPFEIKEMIAAVHDLIGPSQSLI